MLKRVALTNVFSGHSMVALVDTDTDEKALVGSGKTAVETAKITDVTGLDEQVQRLSSPRQSVDDRVALFQGLAKCLERNISIIKSFQLQASRMRSPRFRGAIADVAESLTAGEKVSDSLAKHPDLFGADMLALIRAGEESGQLPEIFRRIAESQKKTSRILRKLKTGMIYPVLVIAVAIAVIIVMSFTLVPQMSKLYGSLGADLPLATQGLMKVSEILLHQPWLVALPVIGLVMLFRSWRKIIAVPAVQEILIRLPVVSGIVRKTVAAVSFRTLALLMDAHVRMGVALDIARESAWHNHYRKFFTGVERHINEGRSLPEAFLSESHWLGPDGRIITGMMEVAAETGSGTEMLNEIAEDYEDELDGIASQIDKLMEPVTIIFLGGIVGLLIYAIYAPVFSLGSTLLKK